MASFTVASGVVTRSDGTSLAFTGATLNAPAGARGVFTVVTNDAGKLVLLSGVQRNQEAGRIPVCLVFFDGTNPGVLLASPYPWVQATIAEGATALASLSDVLLGTLSNGQVLTYNAAASKWENQAGGAGTLAGLTDVSVTEGAPIDGFMLYWNNTAGKWEAKAVPAGTLAALSDVTVTEGPGIDGFVLYWNNSASKWEAKAIPAQALSGLSDVTVTEGAGIDGQVLYWNNSAGKWEAKAIPAQALAGLTDVAITTPASQDYLIYDSVAAKWKNLPNFNKDLDDLADVSVVEGAGIDGQVLYWNNAAGKWEAKAVGGSPFTLLTFTGDASVTETTNSDNTNHIVSTHIASQADQTLTGSKGLVAKFKSWFVIPATPTSFYFVLAKGTNAYGGGISSDGHIAVIKATGSTIFAASFAGITVVDVGSALGATLTAGLHLIEATFVIEDTNKVSFIVSLDGGAAVMWRTDATIDLTSGTINIGVLCVDGSNNPAASDTGALAVESAMGYNLYD